MGTTIVTENPTSTPTVVEPVTQVVTKQPILVSAETLVGPPGPTGPPGAAAGASPLFVGPTTPAFVGAYLWMETGLGDGTGFTLWMEDGL